MSNEGYTCDCCGDTTEAACYSPLTGVIDALSRKYTMQVVTVVGAHGSLRFGEIEDHVSKASTATISSRLDELVEAEILERTRYDQIPPRVDYALTDEGEELREVLQPVLQWADGRDVELTS